MSIRDRTIPPHLRRYVVEQDYAQYNEMDQAVWRFVVLQNATHLTPHAPAAYREGLAAANILAERIPHLAHIDEGLSPFGFGAVCVDGFLPPRAFKEFQAAGLLPINADIRTAAHLAYTPAPDILHEATGHAPLLVEPAYASFVKRISQVAMKAFGSDDDTKVYEAIYSLSEIKETPGASSHAVMLAEQRVAEAVAATRFVSEATRLSRLYWWTVEYGLVGTVQEFKLYGAGLLSSLGEANHCLGAKVRKVPLSIACVDTAYDITREQPQLFVAKDFDHLGLVLEDVEKSLSFRQGGMTALREARRSAAPATVVCDAELEFTGEVQDARALPSGEPVAVLLKAGARLPAASERAWDGWSSNDRLEDPLLLVVVSEECRRDVLAPFLAGALAGQVTLNLSPACTLRGTLEARAGAALHFHTGRLDGPFPPLGGLDQRFVLHPVRTIHTAFAGPGDASYWEPTPYPCTSVPKPRHFDRAQQRLIHLHERARRLRTFEQAGDVERACASLHEELAVCFPHEWLLRWCLLDLLVRREVQGPLTRSLESELTSLEEAYHGELPILTALRSLGFRGASALAL